jgi:hypothetical protein
MRGNGTTVNPNVGKLSSINQSAIALIFSVIASEM